MNPPCWIVTAINEDGKREVLVFKRFDAAIQFMETNPLLTQTIEPARFSDSFRIEAVEIET
jgi:hypothetical protein